MLLGVGLAINLLPFTVSMPLLVPNLAYIGTAQGTYQGEDILLQARFSALMSFRFNL